MPYYFSDRVTEMLRNLSRSSPLQREASLKAELWNTTPMFAERCIEFEQALGGYSIVGRHNWDLGIDYATKFDHEGHSYIECATIDIAAPVDIWLNDDGQMCADTIPMAETFTHFIEREAIAHLCRSLWKGGQRLRTLDRKIESLLISDLRLKRVSEASDKWETWWINYDGRVAACKFHMWGSRNSEAISYWIFDAQNTVLDGFGPLLKTESIDYSIDPWLE